MVCQVVFFFVKIIVDRWRLSTSSIHLISYWWLWTLLEYLQLIILKQNEKQGTIIDDESACRGRYREQYRSNRSFASSRRCKYYQFSNFSEFSNVSVSSLFRWTMHDSSIRMAKWNHQRQHRHQHRLKRQSQTRRRRWMRNRVPNKRRNFDSLVHCHSVFIVVVVVVWMMMLVEFVNWNFLKKGLPPKVVDGIQKCIQFRFL